MNPAMWDWNAIYLTCFGVGFVFSFVALLGGASHLHMGHFHLHTGGSGHHISPLNGFTLIAFLCWFGGTGYLMHRSGVFGAFLVLLFAAISGLAGASLVFWFFARVLMPRERTLSAEDTEMTGVIGRLSSAAPGRGFGEMLYSQNGARRSAPVRSDDGTVLARGTEVVVMRYERGIAYVRRWDEFEHGLLRDPSEGRTNVSAGTGDRNATTTPE